MMHWKEKHVGEVKGGDAVNGNERVGLVSLSYIPPSSPAIKDNNNTIHNVY